MRSCVRALSVCRADGASSAWLLTMLVLGLLSGCQKQAEISRYTVKKMPPVERRAKASPAPGPAMRPSGHGNLGGERILGAITLQGRTLWVFKVGGPKDVVADQMPHFLTLIRSLKFGTDEDSPPEWTLPDDWTDRKDADARTGRFTTLLMKVDGEELPLVVTRLPIPKERPISGLPLMVVNMWCEQLGLPEKTADDLKAEEQPKDAEVQQLVVAGSKVTLVNFLAPERSAPARPAPVAAKGLPQWKVPENWQSAPGNEFSLAAFEVKDGNQTIKTTVSRAGGDLLQNLNRWRGQLGLKPWSPDEMTKTAKTLSIDGHDGTLVDLVGTDARSNKPSCILGVIVPHGDVAWFFKLTGDVELAQREKENFEAFVQSVKFE